MSNIKNNLIEPKTLQGFLELEPKRQILFNRIKSAIENSYIEFGFLPLDTPILEYSSVLFAKAGDETQKQIYRFNKGDNDLSMRFDLTVPLAKFVAKNYHNLTFPFRRYQIGKVYRGERPQKGRFREFYQCDIDIVGDEKLNILADAEIPAVIAKVFNSLGFTDFTIFISNRKILQGFLQGFKLEENYGAVCTVIDKLKKIGAEKVKDELVKLGLKKNQADSILKFVELKGSNKEKLVVLKKIKGNDLFCEGVAELEKVINGISSFGVLDKNISIDLTIVRGLDYYTGTVFETFITNHEDIGSVCSGGRYDNLAGFYTTKKLPGVGISIGLTRLFDKLADEIKLPKTAYTDCLVVSLDDNALPCIIKVTAELKTKGIKAIAYLEEGKLKNKFKYAEKLDINYMVILGESEIATSTVTIKNLLSGEQLEKVSVDSAAKFIKQSFT